MGKKAMQTLAFGYMKIDNLCFGAINSSRFIGNMLEIIDVLHACFPYACMQ